MTQNVGRSLATALHQQGDGATTQVRPWFRPVHPIAAAALIAPPLAAAASPGMAPLFIAVALATIVAAWRDRPWCDCARWAVLPLVVAVLWGAISTLWAIDVAQTARTSLLLGAEFAAGLTLFATAARLDETDRAIVGRVLLWGMTLALAYMAVETFTPGLRALVRPPHGLAPEQARILRLTHLTRGDTIIAILTVPTLLAGWRLGHRLWAGALTAAAAVLVAFDVSLSAKIALPASIVAATAVALWPRVAAAALTVTVAALMALSAAAAMLPPPQQTNDAAPWLPPSAHHRVTIWTFTAKHALEKPLHGWGLDAARVIPGADDETVYVKRIDGMDYHLKEAQLPLHPHNGLLQIWLELGLVGLLATWWLLGRSALAAARLPPVHAAAALAALAAGVVVASVSFGIWQSWWQGSMWLAAALIAAHPAAIRR